MEQFNGLPPELQGQALALRRKQAIAQALMQRSMQPIQAPTNQGRLSSVINPLAAVAQAVQGYAGGKLSVESDREQGQLATDYQGKLKDAVNAYMLKRSGRNEVPYAPVDPDPRGAAVDAITSGFPQVQAIGQMDLANQQKDQMFTKDWLGQADKFSPNSVVAAAVAAQQGHPNPMSLLQPKKQFMAVNDNLLEVTGDKPQTVGSYGDQWARNPDGTPKITQIAGADGKPEPYLQNQTSGDVKKLDNSTRVTVSQTNSGDKFQSQVGEEQAKLVSGALKTSRDSAVAASNDLKILSNAIDIYNKGIQTGSMQGLRTEVGKFAETTGMKSPDPKVSNTDFFMKTMASRILQHTKELRPLSDTDRKYLEDIMAGRNLTDAALRRLLEIGVSQGEGAITSHNQLIGKQAKLPGAIPGFGDFYSVEMPTNIPRLGATPQAIDAVSNAIVKPMRNINGLTIELIEDGR